MIKDNIKLLDSIIKKGQIVDLTMILGENLPCFAPQGQIFSKTIVKRYDTPTQSFVNAIYMTEHVGTHCDAPAHLIPPPNSEYPHKGQAGLITTEKIKLDKCLGPAAVIDCRNLYNGLKASKSEIIPVSFVKNWEIKYGKLMPEDIVLFYTGWADIYYRDSTNQYSYKKHCEYFSNINNGIAPDSNLMNYLVEKGIKHIGGDWSSAGPLPNDKAAHWAALGKGIILVEKLVNLGKLPPRGSFYIFLPLKIEGGSGGPGRAIAIM